MKKRRVLRFGREAGQKEPEEWVALRRHNEQVQNEINRRAVKRYDTPTNKRSKKVACGD